MQRLIVPVDGSQLCENAFPWAAQMARTHNLSLHLVYVVRTRRTIEELKDDAELLHAADESIVATQYLEKAARWFRARDLPVQTEVAEGNIGAQIVRIASERDAFAIVMATHARRGISRLRTPSVLSYVLRESEVPVLAVPAANSPQESAIMIQTVVVPLDGSAFAAQALPYAQDLVARNGQIILVRSVGHIASRNPSELDATAADQAQTYLNEIAQRLRTSGVDVQTLVLAGNAADQISRSAETTDADLIVMTTRGLSGLHGLRPGSTASAALRTSRRPVLIVGARARSAKLKDQCSVADVMNRDVPFVLVSESLASGMRKLLRRGASAVPVVSSQGDLVGLLTARRLLEWQVDQWTDPCLSTGEIWDRAETIPVTDMVPRQSITIATTATASAAARTMVNERLDAAVVTEDGRPVGIVAIVEMLGALSKLAGEHTERGRAQPWTGTEITEIRSSGTKTENS